MLTKHQFLNNPLVSEGIWELWLESPCSSKYQLRPDGKGALFQHYQECIWEVYVQFSWACSDDTIPEDILEMDYEGSGITPSDFWDANSYWNETTPGNPFLTQKELNKKFFNIVNNHKELDNEPGYFNQLNLNI